MPNPREAQLEEALRRLLNAIPYVASPAQRDDNLNEAIQRAEEVLDAKAISMWFKLADKVAERYGIPFTQIDELAKFMQSAAYAIVTEEK